MEIAALIALAIYVVGAAYGLFFVGIPILLSADCDHAFILLLPYCVVLPFVWPLVLIWCLVEHVRGAQAGDHHG